MSSYMNSKSEIYLIVRMRKKKNWRSWKKMWPRKKMKNNQILVVLEFVLLNSPLHHSTPPTLTACTKTKSLHHTIRDYPSPTPCEMNCLIHLLLQPGRPERLVPHAGCVRLVPLQQERYLGVVSPQPGRGSVQEPMIFQHFYLRLHLNCCVSVFIIYSNSR